MARTHWALLAAVGVSLTSLPALAQETRGIVAVDYEMAVPVASFRDVHEAVSFRGLGADVRYFLHPSFTLGGSMSVQTFHDDYPERTITKPDGAVTARLDEYTQVWQLRAVAHYYLMELERVSPYVGVGAGYAWANRFTLVTDFSVQDTASAFALTPELGVLVNFDPARPAGLMASLRYNFTTAETDRISSLSYVSWTVGGFFGF